jgi:sarcosine oxidase subunit alpha
MAASVELAKRGRAVELVDDDLSVGGCLRSLLGQGSTEWQHLLSEFDGAVRAGAVIARPRTTAAGVYGDDILVAGEGGLDVLNARTVVLAPGSHDGGVPFEGNDLPGVMSARAGARILAHGAVPGERVALVVTERDSPFAEAFVRAQPKATRVEGMPERASGGTRVRQVTVQTPKGLVRLRCDTLLVDAPGAPAHELCLQAGAAVERRAEGFFVVAQGGGAFRPGFFALGEVVGTPLKAGAMAEAARAMAERT